MADLSLTDKKILILGATGFVGSRLTEKLTLEHHAQVTVMSRNYGRASSVARYPVRLVKGDVTNIDDALSNFAGHDIVIDCTYPAVGILRERIDQAVLGAKTVCDAVLRHRIPRLVHMSTIAVYGPAKDGCVDETQTCSPSGDAYGDSKLAGERVVLKAHRRNGLPVVVLQPTVIYGPFAAWSAGPLLKLKEGRVALPNSGQGYCNAVYIDDVVDAIILAASVPEIEGERFLISGEAPVTWRQYYEAYQTIAGGTVVLMSAKEIERAMREAEVGNRPIRRLVREFRNNPSLRQLLLTQSLIKQVYGMVRWVLPERTFETTKQSFLRQKVALSGAGQGENSGPLFLPAPNQMALLSAKAHVKIDKAMRLLGYHPRFDLDSGMALIAQWAKWARLTNPDDFSGYSQVEQL